MTRTDAPHDLVDSLRRHCTELETTDPDADSPALRAFDDALGGVDVVGLGEATHRTREFFAFKHRFVRYLVTVHGFRTFALEASFSETVALHDYVVHGRGDLQSILEDIGFQIYETEEMVAFLEWMRSFNEDRPLSGRVAVYGFDVQSAAGAAAALRAFFRESDGERPPEGLLRTLDEVADGVFEGEAVDRDRLRAAEHAAEDVADWFEHEREGDADTALARQHLRTFRRACEFARTGEEADRAAQWGLRDRYMAETVDWIRERAPDDRVAVWAHNNHVKTGRLSGDGHPSATMGEHLSRRYGSGYYALGAQFGRGAVRAYAPTDGDGVEFDGTTLATTELAVPAPEEGSVPELFARLEAPVALLDYRSLSEDSLLRSWLAEQRRHRYVAGVVDPAEDSAICRCHAAADEFDGVFFVRSVGPSTPL
ncbi:erythromycin esterase family protein [Halobacterium wangiae]|uniref:erythromycin esterase family protein n=1 Tax=Halobacterium wangiae TaxID=2902623 RepID=UPI001E2E0FCB|nr:erythromycin esterase family protein [Halobacterium wangiae]